MTKNIKPQDVNKWLTKRQGSPETVTQRDHTPHSKSIKCELVLNFMTYKKGLLSIRGKGYINVFIFKPVDLKNGTIYQKTIFGKSLLSQL